MCFSFLNRREDGTTSLCVLNSDNDNIVYVFQLSFLNRREDGTTALCTLNSDNDGIGRCAFNW